MTTSLRMKMPVLIILATAAVLLGTVVPAVPAHASDGSISGTLSFPAAAVADGVRNPRVSVVSTDSSSHSFWTVPDSEGQWSIDLPPGEYALRFSAEFFSRGQSQYWGELERPWLKHRGEVIQVGDGQHLSDFNTMMVGRGGVEVDVNCNGCFDMTDEWMVHNFQIEALDAASGTWRHVAFTDDVGGPMSAFFTKVLPGHYRLSLAYAQRNGPVWGFGSTQFDLLESQQLIVPLSAGWPDTERISGPDRFAVAAAISREAFPAGADVVYVASGADFPDALGGGPAALEANGPLLLVSRTGIPSAIRAELTRLDPERIVVLGGEPTISSSVVESLAELAEVHRIAGADRYETSIETARFAFPTGAAVVYLSTGKNFPDALSAGPAAMRQGGTVIIVDGSSAHADPQLLAVLEELEPTKLYVIGDSLAVSDAFKQSLVASGHLVERIGGADRWETSAHIAGLAFTAADKVFMAVGTRFPDALTGGVLAGVDGVPLIVSPPSCTPLLTSTIIVGLQPDTVTLLGDTSALAEPTTLFGRC
jgi:putative cell wall-binding protein